MNIPFLSSRLPHGTSVFLTEWRRSSIRVKERVWPVGKSEHGNQKEQMIWVAS
jgi:hypothetical protein